MKQTATRLPIKAQFPRWMEWRRVLLPTSTPRRNDEWTRASVQQEPSVYDRVFYDSREGQYYNRATDLYLTLKEAHAFGVR